MTDLFGVGGQRLLDEVELGKAYRIRVESLRDLIEIYDREIAMLEKETAPYFAGDLGFHAVQAIPGVGPVLAAVFVAEIGDIGRFTSARHLCSWAGLTPTHHESDEKVRRGHITKQGSRLVRLGRRRGGGPPAGRHTDSRSPPTGGRAPWKADRTGGGRPQTSHPRLLRPA
jgi:transposase